MKHMRSRLLYLLGFGIIPVCLILPLFIMRSLTDNYSGFLAAYPHTGRIFGTVILGWIWFLLEPHLSRRSKVLTAVVFIASVLIPYREGTLSATMHLCTSYASFLLICYFWYTIHRLDPRSLRLWTAVLFLCAMLCFTASSISGIAEFVFMSFTSATLAIAYPERL